MLAAYRYQIIMLIRGIPFPVGRFGDRAYAIGLADQLNTVAWPTLEGQYEFLRSLQARFIVWDTLTLTKIVTVKGPIV